MPNLIATKELRYAGVNLHAGDAFEASEKDAKLLKAIKRARDYTENSPNASDLPVEVMQRSSRREPLTEVEEAAEIEPVEPVEEVAEVEDAPVVEKAMKAEAVEDATPKPQTYLHRAMVAQTPKAKLAPKKTGRRGKGRKSQS